MYSMDVISAGVFGYGDQVNGSARSINDRRRSDADLRSDLAAAAIVAGHLTGQCRGSRPQSCARASADAVGIERENTAVLGGNVEDIFRSDARNEDIGEVKRLRVHFANHREFAKFAELSGIHVCSGEDGFAGVLAGGYIVGVLGHDVDGRGRSGSRTGAATGTAAGTQAGVAV